MTNRATRVRVGVVAPAVAAVATLSGIVAVPQAMAEPLSHSQATHVSASDIARSGRPAAGDRYSALDQSRSSFGTRVTASSVVNFGLSTTQAKHVQNWLHTYWGYNSGIDGLLGTNSWKAFQRCLKTYWGYTGAIDGIPGSGTVKALQRLLRYYGYTGPIDGIAGSGTQAAFKRFADAH